MSNTSAGGVSSLPKNDQILLKEEEWKELLEIAEFSSFDGLSSVGTDKTKHKSKNISMRWTKKVDRIVMRCFYQSGPTHRENRKRMVQNRFVDQPTAIRTNGWLSKIELD